jgi:hypothetical protein
MLSVQLLLRNWDDSEAYTSALLEEFRWMNAERLVVDKLILGKKLSLKDAHVLKQNSRRMGMRVGLRVAASLLKHLQ